MVIMGPMTILPWKKGFLLMGKYQSRWKKNDHHWPSPQNWLILSNPTFDMAVCQNLVPLVNIKIAGKWMFIPVKMVLIGIDPYPYLKIYVLNISPWISPWISHKNQLPMVTKTSHINHQAVWGSASRAPRFAAMVSNSQTVHQNMSEPEAIERWLAFPLNLIILSRTCC